MGNANKHLPFALIDRRRTVLCAQTNAPHFDLTIRSSMLRQCILGTAAREVAEDVRNPSVAATNELVTASGGTRLSLVLV